MAEAQLVVTDDMLSAARAALERTAQALRTAHAAQTRATGPTEVQQAAAAVATATQQRLAASQHLTQLQTLFLAQDDERRQRLASHPSR